MTQIDEDHKKFLPINSETPTVIKCQSVWIKGLNLAKQGYYCLEQSEVMAKYFSIHEIYIIDQKPYIIGQQIKANFNEKLFSYIFKSNSFSDYSVLNPHDLICSRTYHPYVIEKNGEQTTNVKSI